MGRLILEGLKDDDQNTFINLDYSKAFDGINHQQLAAVLQAVGFKPNRQNDLSPVSYPSAIVQLNGKRSGSFALSLLV